MLWKVLWPLASILSEIGLTFKEQRMLFEFNNYTTIYVYTFISNKFEISVKEKKIRVLKKTNFDVIPPHFLFHMQNDNLITRWRSVTRIVQFIFITVEGGLSDLAHTFDGFW